MPTESPDTTRAKDTTPGNYASVNGLSLYYEIHGERGATPPLILLHGGLGSVEMFAELIPTLTAKRQAIGVDLQAHGRTADIDRPLRFESLADDIAALCQHLGIDQVDIMGYSLGGGMALQAAIRHPNLVRKLVLVSTPCKRDGWYPEVLQGMNLMGPEAAEMMRPSPVYQLYASIAPRPEDWPVLHTKTAELLRQPYDWCEQVKELKAHTMLVFGDADSVRPEHVVEMFELLGGGQGEAGWDESRMPKNRLAILPATSHYRILESPVLPPIVLAFLDASAP